MDQQNNFNPGPSPQPYQPPTGSGMPGPENHNALTPDNYIVPEHQIPDHTTPDPAPVTPPVQYTPQMPAAVSSQPEPMQYKDDKPVPVVRVLSVRGIEYAMMTFMLWFGAASLILILVSLVQGQASFDVLSFPLALLLISLPIFAFLFLRLRKAELADPSLRLEPSKRRFTQLTQIFAFLTCFFNLVALAYILIGMAGGNKAESLGKTIGSVAVVLVIAGGILWYYWTDEHKLIKR